MILENLGVENVIFSGGEPTLHPDIISVVREADEGCDSVAVISNAVHPEMLSKLAHHADIWVSLDWYGSRRQDEWRGFNGLWSNYESIADIVNVRATLLRDNLEDVQKLITYAAEKNRKTTVMPCRTHGKLAPTPQQLQQLLVFIFNHQYQDLAVVDDPCVRLWVATKKPDRMRQLEDNGSLCPASQSVIRVSPQSIVKPCPFLDWPICNLHNPQLKEKLAATRQKLLQTFSGQCETCKWRKMCGGCRASDNQPCFMQKAN